MKIVLLLLNIVTFLSYGSLTAQTLADSVYTKRPGGYTFFQNGQKISKPRMNKILKTSPAAHEEYKKAQTSRFFSTVIATIGGACLGWVIGDITRGEKFNWTVAGIGTGLLIINIPIYSSDEKHTRAAVRLYNSGLQ